MVNKDDERLMLCLKSTIEDQRDGSVIKSPCCFCRGPGFSSQHPHGNSQFSVTTVPGDLIPSLTPRSTRHEHGTQTYMQAQLAYTQNNNK